jgi:hypothetical protein
MKFIIIKIVIEFLIYSIVEWYYSSMPPLSSNKPQNIIFY